MVSALLFRDEVVRDARVFALVLKSGVVDDDVGGEEGDAAGNEFMAAGNIVPE